MTDTIQAKIKLAGGVTRVAKAMNMPVTTVHSWARRDKVPFEHRAVFDAALRVAMFIPRKPRTTREGN